MSNLSGPCGECYVIFLYFGALLCLSVCVCELFGETNRNVFGSGLLFCC